MLIDIFELHGLKQEYEIQAKAFYDEETHVIAKEGSERARKPPRDQKLHCICFSNKPPLPLLPTAYCILLAYRLHFKIMRAAVYQRAGMQ